MHMTSFVKLLRQQSRQENLLYLALWAMLFVAPVLSMYVRSIGDSNYIFQWTDLQIIWPKFLLYLLLFLVHNFLLAPILVYGHKRTHYTLLVLSIVAVFTFYQCTTRPPQPPHFNQPPMEMAEKPHHRDVPPPPIIGEHDLMAVIILILMFGMNLGIKGYFKSREDEKNHQAMEKENLEQQLEYLKYQLNPHFLMNTLNNIHALIEIEPPKAQEAVILLSKILRYVLYESNKPLVLMSQELSFMESYVTLMRMRFDDRLRFTAVNPDDGSDVSVPPLLFISFVENAFKHGVSYQEDSFIEVEGKRYQDEQCRERLLWTCRNSKHHVTTHVPKEGGVGMNNVRRRLDLIFTDDYTLDIHEDEQIYEVRLDIPLDVKK